MSERRVLVALLALLVLMAAAELVWPMSVPLSAMVVPAVIAGWRLSWRTLVPFSALIMLVVAVEVVRMPTTRTMLSAGIVVLVLAMGLRYASLRRSWGLSATQGMPILLELRDQVRALGDPPELAHGWVLARALRSAGDEAFRGDFTLAQRDGDQVEAMVVDVSGHGLSAAGRGTQLAGAFGALIQAVPAHETLRACNDYVVRQSWERDYATAAHLVVDQVSGRGWVRCAGHPAPRVRRADGRWDQVDVRGRVLGLAPGAAFGPAQIELAHGDCVVMVTDGVLDDSGVDTWAGAAAYVDRWLAQGAAPGTHALPRIGTEVDDDQTIVVLYRATQAADLA